MLTLKNRTAIISGGTKGIGFSIAKIFAENGMNVILLSSNKLNVRKALDEFNKLGLKCDGFCCDVRNIESIENTFKEIYLKYNSFDVLVNSAGVLDMSSIEDMTMEHWENILAVNLTGTFFSIQKAIPYLKESSFPRIINISSNAGRMGGFENGLAYTASKGGVISLTYGFARRLAKNRITVNCIAPGTVKTEMSKAYDEDSFARLIERFPLGRFGQPEEIASAACYFASEESGFTTGAVLDVNGGMFMG
jgi:NAD(P)-dependent dehydrogenase (short-subunit alcohol dehydrogenase family)